MTTATIINHLSSDKAKKIALEIICFLFILMFTYAAVVKLMDVEKFIGQILQSPLLRDLAGMVAWMIPILELLIAGMLALTRLRLLGLYAAFSLMLMFTAYIIVILNFSEKIPCACGGILAQMGWTEHLVFNIVFVIMGLGGIILHTQTIKSNQPAMT